MAHEKKSGPSTILLIEADTSLRRIIALGLQNRGDCVIEADTLADLLSCDTRQLNLVILDVDNGLRSNWSALEAVQAHPHLSTLPTVVLGWDFPLAEQTYTSTVAIASSPTHCLTKPFDARILHTTIDLLLDAAAEQKAQEEASAEADLLASYSRNSAPSIWPIMTAAGLLLAVIGMLLQVTLAIAGTLLVIVALLLWTLNTKSVSSPVAIPG